MLVRIVGDVPVCVRRWCDLACRLCLLAPRWLERVCYGSLVVILLAPVFSLKGSVF